MNEKTQSTNETIINNAEGDKPRSLDKVERAEQAVERMEAAEKRLDEKIAKLTELQADRLLGGTAGGHIEPKPVKVETAKEYADRVMNNNISVKKDD